MYQHPDAPPTMGSDPYEWHGRITVDYDAEMNPVHIGFAYVDRGYPQTLHSRPISGADDVDELVAGYVRRGREIGRQLALF